MVFRAVFRGQLGQCCCVNEFIVWLVNAPAGYLA